MNLHHGKHSSADSCCLRVQNLGVRIGSSQILYDVNMHIHTGQMAALIGPNGAGKSTLIKAILGQREYSGVITFSQPGSRQRKMRIGYVPQSPSFDPGDPVSVADLFQCCTSRRPAFLGATKQQRERVLDCLSMVHGEDLVDKRVRTLSGGELQRVLLALALEPMPNILILDEPLSGVDVEGMRTLMEMIDGIRKEFGLVVLMITHDFSLLERYMDQVFLIDGTVSASGTPAEVLSSEVFKKTFHMEGLK